jgi:hypothetical protein
MIHMDYDQVSGDKLYIDVDILYADFLRSVIWQRIMNKIPAVEVFINAKFTKAFIRPSSNGNAHISLCFARPLTVLEGLSVRSWLYDDKARLILDLVRYLKTHDPAMTNRLWSGKYKKVDFESELKLCGAWVEVTAQIMPLIEAWKTKTDEEKEDVIRMSKLKKVPEQPATEHHQESIPITPDGQQPLIQ